MKRHSLAPVPIVVVSVLGALVPRAFGAPPRGTAPASSAAGSAHASTSTSASVDQGPAPPPAAAVRSSQSAIERAATELRARIASPPPSLVVAARGLDSDEPLRRSDELLARVLSVVGGKFPNAHVERPPTPLANARAAAGRAGGLLYVSVAIEKGKLRVVADVYPAVSNAWERLKNPLPEPQAHEFVEVPVDAEVRAFLPPILLDRASLHRARIDDDVVALGCGDIDGDGGLDLVTVSDKRVATGHVHGSRFVVDRSVQLARIAQRAPVPLREPIGSVVTTRADAVTRVWLGSTDFGGVALDGTLARAKSSPRIPFATERGVMCATPVPEAAAFEGPLVTCADDEEKRELAVPAARFDAYAFADIVARTGGSAGAIVAAREPGGKLRVSRGEAAIAIEGVGAEIALGDLDQDGVVEIVTSLDGAEDALVIQSWDGGALRPRLRLPAPAGVRAITVCPPENRDAPFVAAVVGSEVWLVR